MPARADRPVDAAAAAIVAGQKERARAFKSADEICVGERHCLKSGAEQTGPPELPSSCLRLPEWDSIIFQLRCISCLGIRDAKSNVLSRHLRTIYFPNERRLLEANNVGR